jgi:hypothetical protein
LFAFRKNVRLTIVVNEEKYMSSEAGEPAGLSRRDFIKAGLGIAAGAGLTYLGMKLGSQGEKVRPDPVLSPEQIEFLRSHTKEPSEVILGRLKAGARLVGVGEIHGYPEMFQLMSSVIDKAAQAGDVQFVGIEQDRKFQPHVDAYLNFGKMDYELKSLIHGDQVRSGTEGLQSMLEVARKRRVKVLCLDEQNLSLDKWVEEAARRDHLMKQQILSYMSQYPDQRGFFYAGYAHVAKYRGEDLSDSLKESYSSVIQMNQEVEEGEVLYRLIKQAGISRPIGIEDLHQSPFAKIRFGRYEGDWAEWGKVADAVIVYPPDPTHPTNKQKIEEVLEQN